MRNAPVMGRFISRGISVPGVNKEKKWDFVATAKIGDRIAEGDILGTVKEYHIEHRIMVPPGISGTIREIRSGAFTVEEPVCILEDNTPIKMLQKWHGEPKNYSLLRLLSGMVSMLFALVGGFICSGKICIPFL